MVNGISSAIGHHVALLNIHPGYRTKIVSRRIHYRERPVDLKLEIAAGCSKSLQFELIQVIRRDTKIDTDLIDNRG